MDIYLGARIFFKENYEKHKENYEKHHSIKSQNRVWVISVSIYRLLTDVPESFTQQLPYLNL